MNDKGYNFKIILPIIVILISAGMAILFLLDAFRVGSNMDPDIAFGLSIIAVQWCKYEYDEYLSKRANEEIEEKYHIPIIIFDVLPRIMLLSIGVLWLLDVSGYGFLIGSAACCLLGFDALLEYKRDKCTSAIIFSAVYFSIVAMTIVL